MATLQDTSRLEQYQEVHPNLYAENAFYLVGIHNTQKGGINDLDI
jgi:hypothetical protein